MDWIENLLPFVLLFIYFLSRLGKNRQRQGRAAAPSAPRTEPEAQAAPTSFEELIRQIQKAAEETRTAQKPTPAAPRPSRPAPPPIGSDFRLVGGFEHEEHGFGPENPFSDENFERLPRGLDVTEHAPGHLSYDPHGIPRTPATPAPKRRHPLAERLRTPGSAREAFALREILDAPRSRRPRR